MATEVRLHRSLYDASAVDALAGAYAGVANLAVDIGEHEVTVTFDAIDPDVADTLVDHFCNHVLSETIVRRNQSEATMLGSRA